MQHTNNIHSQTTTAPLWYGFFYSTMTLVEKLKQAVQNSYHCGRKDVSIVFSRVPKGKGYISKLSPYTPRIIRFEHNGRNYAIVGRYEMLVSRHGNTGYFCIKSVDFCDNSDKIR